MVLPGLVSARSVSEIVNASARVVSRANFLSWSFEVLSLPKEDGTCTLPYARAPRALKGMLCAAQTEGALTVFGNSTQYPLSQSITRGEAIIVLTALTNKQERADVSAYKDVVTTPEKEAVANAIALKWMVPQRSTMFGLRQKLTGTEALSLLQAVSGKLPAQVETITINLNPGAGTSVPLPRADLITAIWQLIQQDYLYKDKMKDDEVAYKTIEGLVDSLGDPYTTFFRPVNADAFQSQIKGELSGIGAQIEDKDGVITVVAPIPGSPAERAGILPGDEFLEANGNPLKDIGVDKAVTYIRGQRGTNVILKIRRSGSEMTITVQREVITIPEISVTWQGDIAILQLTQFGETTEKKIRSTFSEIAAKRPKGIVIDLRNNGGGLLLAADTLMSALVPRGSTVAQVVSPTETSLEKTQDDAVVDPSTKIAVLVNKGSASASEIVAGALQDLKRATIVGKQTFGKGTVQEVIGFRTGEALKLTIAEWLTPNGRHIDKVGVTPDVVVDSDNRDDQLRRALDILR
jgi:carboxyl-terminal processing protease